MFYGKNETHYLLNLFNNVTILNSFQYSKREIISLNLKKKTDNAEDFIK
jgi:hypothetical protein